MGWHSFPEDPILPPSLGGFEVPESDSSHPPPSVPRYRRLRTGSDFRAKPNPRFKDKVKPRGRQRLFVSVPRIFTPLSGTMGVPPPKGNREKGVRKTLSRHGPRPGPSRAASALSRRDGAAPPQARRGHPAGLFLRRRPAAAWPLAPGNMAAPITAPGRALLRVGAERLLPGGVRALLRPRLEGGTPGPERDFSLSHSRVRARRALRGP